MASKRMISKNSRLFRRSQNQEYRSKLKQIIKSEHASGEEKDLAVKKLNKLSIGMVRYVRRCNFCGRPKGVYRDFGLCRCCLRKYTMLGMIPGLTKASW